MERLVNFGYNAGKAFCHIGVLIASSCTVEDVQVLLLVQAAPLAVPLIILDNRLCGNHHLEVVCDVVRAVRTVDKVHRESVAEVNIQMLVKKIRCICLT